MIKRPGFHRLFTALLGLAICAVFSSAVAQENEKMNEGETVADAAISKNKAMKDIPDVPGLPRVLLIGDSISIAYTLPVRELLKGKANVHRIPGNGMNTANGLKQLNNWLGTGKWDVIHFNFGLWDAKHKGDTTQVPREDYEKNLSEIVKRLQATGAKIIFATTTPVPELLEPPTRHFDNIPARNEIAVKVMKQKDVAVDDLYTAILPKQAEYQRPKDVHFNTQGSALLAKSVAESIGQELPKK